MARVRQWITGFLKRHQARFKPHDWPDGSDAEDSRVFLELWIKTFATKEVTEAEAEDASVALGETPPNFCREHLPMVLARVEAIRKARGTQPGTGSREAVRDESRNCPHCSGEGLATAWAEHPDLARRIPESVAAYCVCAHGRHIKRNHSDKSPELLRRIPDFGEVLDGLKPGWLAHPPGREEMQAQEPEAAPERPISKAQIDAMFRMPN